MPKKQDWKVLENKAAIHKQFAKILSWLLHCAKFISNKISCHRLLRIFLAQEYFDCRVRVRLSDKTVCIPCFKAQISLNVYNKSCLVKSLQNTKKTKFKH